VKLWEVATGKERATLKGHKLQVLYAAFTPDGRVLATTSGEAESPITDTNEKPGEIKLWDPFTGEELASLRGHNFRVWSVVFAPDGKTMATAAEDRTVKLWDVAPRSARPARELAATSRLWADLAAEDTTGLRAVGNRPRAGAGGAVLAGTPASGRREEEKRAAGLVVQLDDDDFAAGEGSDG
jgi:hypothetical protein